eukprot:GFYU01044340.1.p1 GENE.GFYU01044340.1~~GFYU01044340.1.p1  ORF type:complete len:104 (-),score=34.24 GFYU01044340.1:65-343(-)
MAEVRGVTFTHVSLAEREQFGEMGVVIIEETEKQLFETDKKFKAMFESLLYGDTATDESQSGREMKATNWRSEGRLLSTLTEASQDSQTVQV